MQNPSKISIDLRKVSVCHILSKFIFIPATKYAHYNLRNNNFHDGISWILRLIIIHILIAELWDRWFRQPGECSAICTWKTEDLSRKQTSISKISLFMKKHPKSMIKELQISSPKLLDKKLLTIWQRKLSTSEIR